MNRILVIAVLCVLLVGVGGVASLALTTPVVGPTHGTGQHPPSRAYDLIGRNEKGPFQKVGKIYFDVPARTFEAQAHLDPSDRYNQGKQTVDGIYRTTTPSIIIKETAFGICVLPDKTGKVYWRGTLTEQNIQWLSKYQNSDQTEYRVTAGCLK